MARIALSVFEFLNCVRQARIDGDELISMNDVAVDSHTAAQFA